MNTHGCSVIKLSQAPNTGRLALLIHADGHRPACLVLISASGFLEVRGDVPFYFVVKEVQVTHAFAVHAWNLLDAQSSFSFVYADEVRFLIPASGHYK